MPTIQQHLHGHGSKHTANHWLWLFSHYCFTSFHVFRKPSETNKNRLVLQSYTVTPCEFFHVFRPSESSDVPKEDFQRSTETGQGAKLNEEDVKGLIKVTLWDPIPRAVDQNLAPKMDGGYGGFLPSGDMWIYKNLMELGWFRWSGWTPLLGSTWKSQTPEIGWNWLVKVNI